MANGEVSEIPGGVRRHPKAGDKDRNKGSFLWDAVRFSHKTFTVAHAVKNIDTDYVLWLDADTFTFRPITKEFVLGLLSDDKLVNYLGRVTYPECGWVCYNRRHEKINEFINEWTKLYNTGSIFNELEWHDSYVFWHLSKEYRKNKNITVNDIGYWKGVKGHHVFVNSELGLYMDHLKGKRKKLGTSAKNDLRANANAPADIMNVDYWKQVPPSLK